MLKRLIPVCLAAAFVLCGCGGTADDDSNINQLEDGNLIVRENVNEINVAAAAFDTFNPIMTKSVSVAEFMKTVCEPLFEYDEACNPIGVLARNYQMSADGLTASFDLTDAQFHDFTPLAARDVIYTVNMIKNNETFYSDSVKYIRDIFSDESGRVYIRLTKPVVNFEGLLNFPIVKSGTPAEADANYIPIGTGPCRYRGKKTANQIEFYANDDWHGGKPGFKTVTVNLLKDSETILNAFDAGEIDVIASTITGGNEKTPRGAYNVNEYTGNALTFLGFNNTSGKLSGRATRKALELLCNKKAIADVEMYSKAVTVKYPINPSAWFYPEEEEEVQDFEKIQALLEEDGWIKADVGYYREENGDRRELILHILVNEENEEKVRIAQNIADSFNAFGISTSLKKLDFDTYKEVVAEKSYDLFVGEIVMDKSMDPGFLTASSGNYFGYYNESMDKALEEMAKAADGSDLILRTKEYAEIFDNDVPFVPLFFKKESVIYNKFISGVVPPNQYQIYREMDKWYISKIK